MRFGPVHVIRKSTLDSHLSRMDELHAEIHRLQQSLASQRDLTNYEVMLARYETTLASSIGGGEEQVEPPTPPPSRLASFNSTSDWVSQFELDGETVGGNVPLSTDERIDWLLETVGGVDGKHLLELGPLEGAHTKMLCEAGVASVVAIEGFRSAFQRCLIIKELFGLAAAKFLYGDFNRYITDYDGNKFDAALASGVLYHQMDPVSLIGRLAKITDTVMVWTHFADDAYPPNSIEVEVSGYRGRKMHYAGARNLNRHYCGGINEEAVWLYYDELLRCFSDSGLTQHKIRTPLQESPVGPAVLFVASP